MNAVVRKAKTLSSLDELKLPLRTYGRLIRGFSSLGDIIWEGRCIAYEYARDPRNIKNSAKWAKDLVSALSEAGFIRQDITSGSFGIALLYRDTYPEVQIDAPMGINNLTNDTYEKFENYTLGQKEVVKMSLRKYLDDLDMKILMYHYGFEDGECHEFSEIAEHFDIEHTEVCASVQRSIERLRNRHALPSLLRVLPTEKKKVDAIIKELDKIHEDPIFTREAELKRTLNQIANLPFDHGENAQIYMGGISADWTGIHRFNVDTAIFSRLVRAGINSIVDVIDFPKARWTKLNYFSEDDLREIENEIRRLGYKEFSIF